MAEEAHVEHRAGEAPAAGQPERALPRPQRASGSHEEKGDGDVVDQPEGPVAPVAPVARDLGYRQEQREGDREARAGAVGTGHANREHAEGLVDRRR